MKLPPWIFSGIYGRILKELRMPRGIEKNVKILGRFSKKTGVTL